MKPIPTSYSGIEFRSRLEATWSSYFDFLGLAWSYEPEGYSLEDGTRYLPDFFLAGDVFEVIVADVYEAGADGCPHCEGGGLFVECKPPGRSDIRKAGRFLSEARFPLLVAMPEGRFAVCGPDERSSKPTDGPFEPLEIGRNKDR